ncbi:ethanolamine ammonia-lyase subunit EutB [Desulfosporosinus sp.]|uniref:ethanolamine ammonia-lyase subunit EutB n=1 Tax=Desulfosporosinus sp. TaxID=157907 RepID=UPI000E9DA76C|nr:ethanolamine ammonia-lyase subunit EutB [Desulfosporosinus sp.]MBC2721638.1 ethanolamine ammonia-lyase subunit EutB [Desulfosporosinus sp.]MBC2728935.1 ethanolamine ammonia-lyase subunit EutB [Desulfosporosinus sp.]HBV85432.1 ethanolamine ammonia lyase large subunit [Desulfosporosinus sp.]
MILKAKVYNKLFGFESLKEVMAKANEEKSGDELVGIAAKSASERVAAKLVLSNLTLEDIYNNPIIPYEEDEVTRAIYDGLNLRIYREIKGWTVGYLREYILDHKTTGEDLAHISRGLTSEMIAAVAKLMSTMDLVFGSKKMRIQSHCNTTLGVPGTLAFRCQPNHPTDNIEGMMASLKEGLSYGSGDAVIGINPVEDNVETVTRLLDTVKNFMVKWEIPTQNCVLAHVTTQMKAIEKGAPVDLVFQSIAGTQKANDAFGVSAAILDEAFALAQRQGTATGPNLMYFETGQGSEVSLDAHLGVDMMTLEARTYGYARGYRPFMTNNVSGFIGPETIYSGREVIRADLEDLFMGKLHGLPMGIAPCYTNHMKADQNDQEMGTLLCAMAGSNFFMGVPGGDDVMLSYQDTSYHDDASTREILGLRPLPEFEQWLEKMGILENGKLTERAGDPSIFDK